MKPKAIRSILALVLLVGLVLATVPAVFADGPVTGEFSVPRVPQSRAVPLAAPSAVTAATVYVRPGGDDTACDGTADADAPGSSVGACAVKTITKGIEKADDGGTVNVRAGTYAENVLVNKPVDIRGPNYGISPNGGVRVAEALVVPATSATATGEIFSVSASGVSINGFTIDGDNPLLTSGYLGTNGANIDAAEGVTVYLDNVNNLTVSKNIFKNLSYFGVTLFGASYSAPATTGHLVDDNLFTDLGTYDVASTVAKWGGGVLLYNNQYTRVTANVMNNVRLGVQTGNFSRANPGAATYQVIDGNTMQVRRVGIFHNLHYGPTSPYTLSNNTITGLANVNEVGVRGILLGSLSVASTSQNNAINLSGVTVPSSGYEVWNVKSIAPAAISGGSVSNVSIGLFLNNYEGYSTDADDGAHASVSGLSITPNAGGTGIRVLDSPSSTHKNVQLAIGAGVTVNGGAKGLTVENASASVTSAVNLALSGQSGNYIELVSNAGDINATSVSFDGVTGATATLAQNFAIEDKIVHKVDNSSLGLVRVKAAELFVTTSSGSIQRGIDAASGGDTINVAAGTYVETGQLVIAKDLTIAGAGTAATIIKPAGDTGASDDTRGWFLVNAGKTFNLSGVTLDGQGKNVYVGILSHGSGTIDGVAFKNIVHPGYQGRGVMTVGDVTQALTVKNCTFNNMGRIGVLVRGAGSTVSIENCTYTGKGPGDWLDYAYEASGGGKMTVKGSSATACTGVAYDGSTSAAILATTYWGPGTTATIENCVLTGNTTGVAVGYDATDTSVVSIWRTDLSGNASEGVSAVVKPVVAEENYWGAVSGPGPVGPGTGVTVSTNVDYEPWCNEDFSICGYTAATMTPTTSDALFCVGESTTVNIDIATVANLYGYQFEVTYNKDMASAVGAFDDSFFTGALVPTGWNHDCTTTPGTCRFSRTKQAPDVAKTGGGTLVTITFLGVAPGTFPVTIVPDAKLTDRDGELLARTLAGPRSLTVCGSTTVSGKVTLQGRSAGNVDPGTVTLTDLGGNFPGPFNASFGNDGLFSLSVPVMPLGSSYQMDAAHPLYLTNQKTPVALSYGVPLAGQNTRLWGGDANNNGEVKIGDLSCIGSSFGKVPPGDCTGGSADINADGKVNVQDLAIAGGNFDKFSPLTW